MSKPRTFWEYQTVRTLSKYFEDGRIEVWLTDDDNNELYLMKSYQHPSGQSPIVEMKTYADEVNPTSDKDK